MSQEGKELVRKIRALDKRITQFQQNDERILRDGGARSRTYTPMAPRLERDREKLMRRLEFLEGRDGITYSNELFDDDGKPDIRSSPGMNKPDSSATVVLPGGVINRDKRDMFEEFISPDSSLNRKPGGRSIESSPAVSAEVAERRANVGRAYMYSRPDEPNWEGMPELLAMGMVGVVAMLVLLAVKISGVLDGIPIPG